MTSLSVLLSACGDAEPPPLEPYVDDEQEVFVIEEVRPPSPDGPKPPAISNAPMAIAPARHGRPPPVLPAEPDRDYASREPVRARRYVYRVRMVVPAGLGDGRDRLAPPSAELFVDVSLERLRARFEGAGWPVPSGSEVRLRGDHHGVYLFDGEGGRPLEPGELASWFEGGEVRRRGPPLRIFPNYGPMRNAPPDDDLPGALVCAFLAELAGEPRENVVRRCEGRGAPFRWRLGFWRAEQTADVPVSLPRAALRADEVDPPAPIALERGRAFLEPSGLRRISPDPRGVTPAAAGDLVVENESGARAIVTVEGMAIGWVDAGARFAFTGLRPGAYELGSIRPLGAVVQRGRDVVVPGTHRICDGRCPRDDEPVGADPAAGDAP